LKASGSGQFSESREWSWIPSPTPLPSSTSDGSFSMTVVACFSSSAFLRDEIAEKFGAVVSLLGDEGIGGDRTVGSGNFCPQFSDAVPDFCQPQKSQRFVNLSPLFPKPEETSSLFADDCNYRLTVRSGWMGGVLPSSVRRKTLRMVGEGSVLCGSADRIWGVMANVTPNGANHPVYRWGYAFPVACEVSPS